MSAFTSICAAPTSFVRGTFLLVAGLIASLLGCLAGPPLGMALARDPGSPIAVRVDTWESEPVGALNLSGVWRLYPRSAVTTFKFPPAIVVDAGRRALRLKTYHESVKIWRAVGVDMNTTPRLVWEWKVLLLPEGGDVRKPTRNDQAARVMVMFEGWKAILYVWDTRAPVGVEVRPDEFAPVDRVLVVARSGAAGLGHWIHEQRDVDADYRRIFDEAPRAVTWVGLESHSDDVQSHSEALIGSIRFVSR